MHLKIIVGVLTVLCTSAVAATALKSRSIVPGQQPEKMKIKTKQLETVDRVAPLQLELIPDAASAATSDSPGALESTSNTVHYKLKNTSGKDISAFGVEIRVVAITYNGKEQTSSVDMSRDQAPHADIRDFDKLQPISPGSEVTIDPQRLRLPPSLKSIKEVTLIVDFVVFEDGTIVETKDDDGAERVLGRRRGAEMYKQWAKKFYNENNRSADMLYERMKVSRPRQVLVFESEGNSKGYEIAGAQIYSSFLMMLYNKDRLALEKYLKEEK